MIILPTCGRPVDRVGVVSLGPGLQQQRADVRFAREASKVETGVVVLVVASIGVCSLLQEILRHLMLPFPGGVH